MKESEGSGPAVYFLRGPMPATAHISINVRACHKVENAMANLQQILLLN